MEDRPTVRMRQIAHPLPLNPVAEALELKIPLDRRGIRLIT